MTDVWSCVWGWTLVIDVRRTNLDVVTGSLAGHPAAGTVGPSRPHPTLYCDRTGRSEGARKMDEEEGQSGVAFPFLGPEVPWHLAGAGCREQRKRSCTY